MALDQATITAIAAFVKERGRTTTSEIAAHIGMSDQKRSLAANLQTMALSGLLYATWGDFGPKGGRCKAWLTGPKWR